MALTASCRPRARPSCTSALFSTSFSAEKTSSSAGAAASVATGAASLQRTFNEYNAPHTCHVGNARGHIHGLFLSHPKVLDREISFQALHTDVTHATRKIKTMIYLVYFNHISARMRRDCAPRPSKRVEKTEACAFEIILGLLLRRHGTSCGRPHGRRGATVSFSTGSDEGRQRPPCVR